MDLSKLNIGVLAVQGDFERHEHQIRLLGARSRQVRLPAQLEGLHGLIMPGGESTTMDIMFDRFNLRQPLLDFAAKKPVYGTCAGMIMLARNVVDNLARIKTLGLMDIDVIRNGYGRQVFSFDDELPVHLDNGPQTVRATFIRAPKVTRVGPQVTVLAEYQDSPVLLRQGRILAGAFHTELDDDTRLLKFFVTNFLMPQPQL